MERGELLRNYHITYRQSLADIKHYNKINLRKIHYDIKQGFTDMQQEIIDLKSHYKGKFSHHFDEEELNAKLHK